MPQVKLPYDHLLKLDIDLSALDIPKRSRPKPRICVKSPLDNSESLGNSFDILNNTQVSRNSHLPSFAQGVNGKPFQGVHESQDHLRLEPKNREDAIKLVNAMPKPSKRRQGFTKIQPLPKLPKPITSGRSKLSDAIAQGLIKKDISGKDPITSGDMQTERNFFFSKETSTDTGASIDEMNAQYITALQVTFNLLLEYTFKCWGFVH